MSAVPQPPDPDAVARPRRVALVPVAGPADLSNAALLERAYQALAEVCALADVCALMNHAEAVRAALRAGRAHQGAAPLAARHRLASEQAPDEARRRVRLAYALLLGPVPWPGEAVLPPADGALPGADADGATGWSPEQPLAEAPPPRYRF